VILSFSRILTATYSLRNSGYLLSSQDVSAELYFAKGALTDFLANDIVAYALCLLFWLFLFSWRLVLVRSLGLVLNR